MKANQIGIIKIEVENRDVVVLGHAVRLGIVTALTKKFPKERGTMVVQLFVIDGDLLRFFIGFSGHPEGDNGYVMYTAPRTPQGEEIIRRLSAQLCQNDPNVKMYTSPLSSCRN